jgi:bile acid-coenzyme A ligase
VREGDFVTICLPNCAEYFYACIAAWKLGAVPNPLAPNHAAPGARCIIAEADPALIVGVWTSRRRGRTLPAGLRPIRRCPTSLCRKSSRRTSGR